jgi:hypothetical protein
MSPPPGIVVVVRGVDVDRIDPINQAHLIFTKACAVDSEGIDTGSPECNRVESPLAEDNSLPVLWGVVEEEPSNIDARRVEILRSISIFSRSETAAYHSQYPSVMSSQGVSDAVRLRVVPETESPCRTLTDPLGPVRMYS